MSIMSEYTIETQYSKQAAIKILKQNIKGSELSDSGFRITCFPLPFYGYVRDNGYFEFNLPFTRGLLQGGSEPLVTVEGSIRDMDDSAKIYVKPAKLSVFMQLRLVIPLVLMGVYIYFTVVHLNFPANVIIPRVIGVAALGVGFTIALQLYYARNVKTILEELLYTDY